MSKRLLPGPRDYSEHDVVNMYALDLAYVNTNITGSGNGDQGVFVTVASGNFSADPIGYADYSYLGNTSNIPHLGANQYPSANLRCKPAVAGDSCLGVALWETAQYDENGEKLLYYRQKAREAQVVLPGQAVPVATRGLFAISTNAYDGSLTIGGGIKLSASSGKVTGWSSTLTAATGAAGAVTGSSNDAQRIGTVIGTGTRTPAGPASMDQFSGDYAVIRLACD